MKTLSLLAALIATVSIPYSSEQQQCPYTLQPTILKTCPTSSQLVAILDQLNSNVTSLLSNFATCLNPPLGTVQSRPANSCQQIYLANNNSQNGLYWVVNSTGAVFQVTCRFDSFANFSSFNATNVTNGFAALPALNMSKTSEQCPSVLTSLSASGLRLCCKNQTNNCVSIAIPTFGLLYQTVCGQVAGYEIGSCDAFAIRSSPTIDTPYVDGVSITYGSGPRRHIWTYATGLYQTTSHTSNCPCTTSGKAQPAFVGTNYYCESGNSGNSWTGTKLYSSDLLWDGQNCGSGSASCCSNRNLPWFCYQFGSSVVGNLELRVCTDEAWSNEDVALLSYEFYVQ